MYYKRKYTPRRRVYRKKPYAKRTARLTKPMRKAVKQVVYRQIETKWNYQNTGSLSPMVFEANQPYSFNLLSGIGQGDSQQTRTGDKINVSDITFSGNIQSTPGAIVHWNVYIVRSSIYRNGINQQPAGTNIGYSAFYKPITNDSDIDIPDHEKVTVLKHMRYTQAPLNNGGVATTKYRLRFDMKKAGYQYDSENGNLGKNFNLYGIIVCDNDQQSQINNGMIVTRFKDA